MPFWRVFAYLTHEPTGRREEFDLSNNTSLRSLEVAMGAILHHANTSLTFLKDLLSTITSPAFSEIVIVVEDNVTHYADFFQHVLSKVVRRLYEVKPFRLVFCLKVWDGDREATVKRLKGYIDGEAAEGGLEFLPCPPVISTQQLGRRKG